MQKLSLSHSSHIKALDTATVSKVEFMSAKYMKMVDIVL